MLSLPTKKQQHSLTFGFARENTKKCLHGCPAYIAELILKYYQIYSHIIISLKDFKSKHIICVNKGIWLLCKIFKNKNNVNALCIVFNFKNIPKNIKKQKSILNTKIYEVEYKIIADCPALNERAYFVGDQIKNNNNKDKHFWSIPIENVNTDIEIIISFDIIHIVYNDNNFFYDNLCKINKNTKLVWNLLKSSIINKTKYINSIYKYNNGPISEFLAGPVSKNKYFWVGIDRYNKDKLIVGCLQRPCDITWMYCDLNFKFHYAQDSLFKEYNQEKCSYHYQTMESQAYRVLKGNSGDNGIINVFRFRKVKNNNLPFKIEVNIKITQLRGYINLFRPISNKYWGDYINGIKRIKKNKETSKCYVCLKKNGFECTQCPEKYVCASLFCGKIHRKECNLNKY